MTTSHESRSQDAFVRDLYAHHATSLLAYVTRILNDPQQAEDVVQETMVRAWQHADRLTCDRVQLHRWLSTVARNVAFDRIRARNARPTEVEETEREVEVTADHAAAVVDSVLLTQALAGLSPKHRQALEHVYLHGYSTTEAAAVLGVPVGTVKTRTHHALRRLRIRLVSERPGRNLRTPRSRPAAAAPGPASTVSSYPVAVSHAG
ncbi:sigma-70 family RNA polymerase sigma factor [Kineosporia mesophila]|uniref:Sigma-70 family RNA polymerase sigma factor n=1 Tax=Kineosporia mesophila TaxID=566012 RepID=A0ABP7AM51_9ACTN|nr:sigma-70 family RNA polymerase sigma factor [Kineosporia mesophila]MCD5354566.1 sigma-70 family RNA polymerase sigma factor [Kineosporia mesophila]